MARIAGTPPPNAGKTYPAEVLTPSEVAAILGQCSMRAPTGIRNRAMLTLLYRSGLRVSEVLAIRPSDIDLGKHTIRLLATKSQKAQTRHFDASADDALARWIDTRKALGIANGGTKLFCTLDGQPVSDRYVRDMIKRYAKRAGTDRRVTPHTFRHTFAVELETAGATVTEISKLLGHSSIAVTARYLDHLTSHEAGAALQRVNLPELG